MKELFDQAYITNGLICIVIILLVPIVYHSLKKNK
jgi:hypothetical protein